MFIYNLKINRKKFVRIFKIVIVLLAILILCLSIYKIFSSVQKIGDSKNIKNLEINSNNYTNFLKDCHENIDKYVGCEVKITGYIYRLSDFNKNQFVIARTMLFDSDSKAVVVGILCESNSSKDFMDYDWVTIEGTIQKGNYKGEMPIVKVKNITKVNTPEDEFVNLPSD